MSLNSRNEEFAEPLLTSGGASQFTSILNVNARSESFDFAYWYPSWDIWNFRRTLSYWIAMLYLEGSTLFIVGAYFSMTDWAKEQKMEYALVAAPYFMGGIAFTLGSYAGILNVVNIPNKNSGAISWCFTGKEQWKNIRKYLGWEPLAGYICYMFGALFFNVNTTYGLGNNFDEWTKKFVVDFPAVIGSVLFTAGGFLECTHNAPLFTNCNLLSPILWLSFLNTFGGFMFLFAAICNMCEISSEEYKWLVDFTYLIGSIAFAFGSFIALWLWKGENYGLGLISEINVHQEEDSIALKPDETQNFLLADYDNQLEQYGCGRASFYQLPWLWMYIINSTASVLDVSLAIEQNGGGNRILGGILNFLLSHGILLLGSIIHHIPTARPHNWLLIYLRIVLLVYTVNSWWGVIDHMHEGV